LPVYPFFVSNCLIACEKCGRVLSLWWTMGVLIHELMIWGSGGTWTKIVGGQIRFVIYNFSLEEKLFIFL